MNLLCCINNDYTLQLLNLLCSIRKYNNDKICLYILTTNLNSKSQNKILQVCQKLNINCNIKNVTLNKDMYSCKHYSVDMYLRLFAFDLLPADVEKVLYLDVDTIVCDDIKKLYDINIDSNLLAAVCDRIYEKEEPLSDLDNDWLEYIKNQNIDHKYINSGVLLLNLKNIRRNWNVKKLEECIASTIRTQCPDQDVLNKLLKNTDLKELEDRFNYYIKHEDKVEKIDSPVIIHYIGRIKPWNTYRLNKWEKLWWQIPDQKLIGKCYVGRKRLHFCLKRANEDFCAKLKRGFNKLLKRK